MTSGVDPAVLYPDERALSTPVLRVRRRLSLVRRHEARLAYALLLPTLLVILGLVAYPFVSAVYLSLQNKPVGARGHFVGLANYAELFRDEVFFQTVRNTIVYTAVGVSLKFVLGLTMALILNQKRRFNNVFRMLLFVPWAVPVIIAALNWRWIFDDLSGFLNNFLITVGLTRDIISWLADPRLAMGCVIAVVVWQGTPFYAMTFLAGLQAIPHELYEAAEIDGAGLFKRIRHITIPQTRLILIMLLMLQIVATMQMFVESWVLTNGGGGVGDNTESVVMLIYQYAFELSGSSNYNSASALGVILMLVLAVFSGGFLWITRERRA
jgi:multiple sugar transport system permease protein